MYKYILSKMKGDQKRKKECVFKIHKYMDQTVYSEHRVKEFSKRLAKSIEYRNTFGNTSNITNSMIQRKDFELLRAFNKAIDLDRDDRLEQIAYSIFLFGELDKDILEDGKEDEKEILRIINNDVYLTLGTGNTSSFTGNNITRSCLLSTFRNLECLNWYIEKYTKKYGSPPDRNYLLKGAVIGDSLECFDYLLETVNFVTDEVTGFVYRSGKDKFIERMESKEYRENFFGIISSQNINTIKRNMNLMRNLVGNSGSMHYHVYTPKYRNVYLIKAFQREFIKFKNQDFLNVSISSSTDLS